MIFLVVDKIVVVKVPSRKIQEYDVFFDAFSSNSNYKSKKRYENMKTGKNRLFLAKNGEMKVIISELYSYS